MSTTASSTHKIADHVAVATAAYKPPVSTIEPEVSMVVQFQIAGENRGLKRAIRRLAVKRDLNADIERTMIGTLDGAKPGVSVLASGTPEQIKSFEHALRQCGLDVALPPASQISDSCRIHTLQKYPTDAPLLYCESVIDLPEIDAANYCACFEPGKMSPSIFQCHSRTVAAALSMAKEEIPSVINSNTDGTKAMQDGALISVKLAEKEIKFRIPTGDYTATEMVDICEEMLRHTGVIEAWDALYRVVETTNGRWSECADVILTASGAQPQDFCACSAKNLKADQQLYPSSDAWSDLGIDPTADDTSIDDMHRQLKFAQLDVERNKKAEAELKDQIDKVEAELQEMQAAHRMKLRKVEAEMQDQIDKVEAELQEAQAAHRLKLRKVEAELQEAQKLHRLKLRKVEPELVRLENEKLVMWLVVEYLKRH